MSCALIFSLFTRCIVHPHSLKLDITRMHGDEAVLFMLFPHLLDQEGEEAKIRTDKGLQPIPESSEFEK